VPYYTDKVPTLSRIFGTEDIEVRTDAVRVRSVTYPVVDDVIVLLPEHLRPTRSVRRPDAGAPLASDIQETFGREWQRFSEVLPEQRQEFEQYFDIVDLGSLADALVCDLGAGMGRWSLLLAPWCRQQVLVDFSDAIFVARQNLRDVPGTVFVMADIADLPFVDDCFDFAMCIGVLHTLPFDPCGMVRSLGRLTPRLLVYVLYALDNRPPYFRALLRSVTAARRGLSRIEDERARRAVTEAITWGVYRPLTTIARLSRRLGSRRPLPLADEAHSSAEGLRQLVYDRFFTSIEHRVSAAEIRGLAATFDDVTISDDPPYWHFVCTRKSSREPSDLPLPEGTQG
jgi:ubiquinone/menaquinone biosynthesis C-methylase UbiE